MTCAEVEAILCDYIDGTLDRECKAAVEQHLAACAACAELARDAFLAVAFLKEAPAVEPPDELLTRLLFQAPRGCAAQRRTGIRGFLNRWMQPVLAPRFAMGMAMTILSFSLLARFIGAADRPFRPSDLNPARIMETVEDRFHQVWDHAVRYYENLRVVYEIQNRLDDWREGEDEVPVQTTPSSPGARQSGNQPVPHQGTR